MATQPEATYNPNGLLDELIGKLGLKNDAALAHKFNLAPPVLSKYRHMRLTIGPSMLVKCHEIGGMTFPQIRAYVPATGMAISEIRELEAA